MSKLPVIALSACGLFVAAALAQDPAPSPPAKQVSPSNYHATSHADMSKDMQMMNEKMVMALGKGDAEYEKRFIDMMIPHHEGAVLMAKDALQKASKPELKKMAEKMIADQEKEIAMLKAYRAQWYGRP